ncbi:allophanate hydrolase subunit 1 [Acidisoma cellulosilytica]|uniref:Allophanate hydrolase subunit 1 n=1 Tax=Acidisoma cellulosilyticum TaxID=2802395 RepID=A0A963Z3Y3_9PROT|nr:allophanate hydrolase subunit 1 [Acidisoma cellulosilyticum]MCB8881303.1 allophanate hydrolase subunit 1 [Acidisoma cellulosilyticum]
MIYETPRFYPAGDRYIEVELGNEMSFDLNIAVHALAAAIRAADLPGVIELIPEMASMQISYDADRMSFADVCREVEQLYALSSGAGDIELDSRLINIPILYFDPWTEACIADYRSRVTDKTEDPELLCALNNLAGRSHLKRLHAAPEYWVAALGFWPGLCSLMPLDPRSRIVAPKYNPPRSWTPKGAIGIGGAITCIYPDRTPGGYQIFARTPVPIWDREQKLPAFRDNLALFRPGDRVRFIPIERDEYDYIEAKVSEGRYVHSVVDYQKFSMANYRTWLRKLEHAA